MADNRIDLVARLNVADSANEINQTDIPDLQRQIKKIEIKCGLDTNGISALKNQLSSLSKNISVNPLNLSANIDTGSSKNVTDKVVDDFNKAFNMIGKMGEMSKKQFNLQTKQMLQEFKDAYQEALKTGDTSQYYATLDKLEQRVRDFNRGDIQQLKDNIEEIRRYFTDGSKVSIGSNLKGWLDNATGSNSLTREYLDAVYGKNNYTIGRGNAGYDTLFSKDEDAVESILNAGKKIIEYQQKIRDTGWGLDELEELSSDTAQYIKAQEEVSANIEDKLRAITGLPALPPLDEYVDIDIDDDINDINRYEESINSLDQTAKKASDDLSKLIYPKEIKSTGNTANILANAKNIIGEELAKNADTANDKVSRIRKAAEDAEGGLKSFVVQVERENKSIETLTYSLNEQGDAYEYLGKTIREADNSSDLRSKDISTQWKVQSENLIKFANDADKAGLASTALKDDIKKLFETLNNANPDRGGDTSSMNVFLDEFDVAKAKFRAFNAEIRKENAIINFNNRIKRLTADVTSYASANQRAVNSLKQMTSGSTFAAEWSRISAEIAKGTELTDQELKILAADMAVFKKEAKAAGLEGESTWSKFLSSFKTMSSYITANMVFNFAKRQIRDMVNEVTAIDTAMTELRKVTEATEDQFEAFAVSASKTGRELGASISDVINATSTFSRAGFNLPDAEELGRVATLYKNVGDGITIDSASESIISIMKAFNIEASNSERIIDRINKVSNNFAVDSGGLGESLKRVASAMASANNTLDETIALTTVANEIVQDPVAVAQAWRTVSMRIRGAKAELEQAGEDTEGMVESTAKLQGLIKGMTGIDIMVDENTFKSTYEIIKELGAVWNDLQDIEQAQVLEAIAGKRQANVVASALRNYERLDDVLQTSIDSQGSARAEQEEYAKSIQYSIDTLKAAYQDFADSVINSDFVKELLGTAQSFLEILTKIIDEFGTLPTILTSIAAVGGLKNIGLFGNLENGLTGVTNKFQSLKQVMLYDFGSLYKKFNINLGGISDSEVQSLQNYVDALKFGVKPAEAMKDIMAGTSEAAQQQATQFTYLYQSYQRGEISANQYRVATQNLALTQRTAAATSKALSIALNTLANIGIMIAINLAIKGISALVDKLIVTKEELAEIRQETLQDLDDLASGIEEVTKKEGEVQSLIEQYHKLVLSTNDLSDNKDELLEIQNSLIEQYGAEKDSLDLLNDSYNTTIEKINALSDAEYAEFERKNSAKIEELEKIRSYNVGWVNEDENGRLSEQVEGANQVYLKGWVDNTDSLAASLYKIEDVSEDIENIWQNIEGIDFNDGWFKNTLYLSGDIYDAYAQLGNLIDAIRASDIDNKAEALAPIEARYKELGQYIQDIDQYLQRKNAHEAKYIETIGQVSLNTLASLKEINAAVGDARASWFENLKDIESGFGKNLDSMITALQNLSDGKSLSRSDFWNLMEFDTNKILTDIKMVGDGFVLNQEQLIKFKDEYIKQQVESLKLDNQNLVTKQEDLKVTLEQAKAELSILGARGMSNAAYREQYQKAYESIKQGEKNLADYGEQIKRNNILIDQWNAKLGDTTDKTKQLQEQQKKLTDEVSKLNEELDNYQKAYEYVIDNIIDGLNDELDVLNEQKQTLQDELDALNEQKDAIEDIIDNYDTVNKLVQDTVEKRKEELEAEKKSIEDSYNERINKLKEENEEREDALEYAQKLANLENARNNKRRVLDETRGWRYESVKEDVVKAENDLASFENEQAVKALEKERDEQVKRIDDIIKSETEYSELWKEISEEIQTEEQELLAEQILGADWREKIANHDIEIISKFRTEYRAHNVELQRITGTEIKLKQAAIEAKDAEIKAKQAQIKEWQNYKKEVQDAVKDIKNAQEDYMRLVGDIQLNENSSLTDRANNFETFKNRVTGYINDIAEKQSALEGVNAELDRLKENGDINISIEGLDDIRTFVEGIGTVSEKMAEYIEKMGEMPTINSPGDAKYWQAAGYKQYSAPQKLTAPTPKIYSAPPPITNSSTSNTNSSLSIGAINVYANNPTELSRGLDKELDKYFRTKLTQSYTQK